MRDLSVAIVSLYPDASWSLDGEDYSGLTWLSENITKPTEAELFAECDRIQSEREVNAYKEQRAAEYPSIGDQLDALFRAGVFPAEMAEQIQAVKTKYPKA